MKDLNSYDKFIHIEGAKEHNLKNLNLDIPRNKLVVVCGPSGSGKSTLAFDIIYAEGQRRYVESLSAYARQFLEQMDKPDVEKIEGLSPSISIEQHTLSKNPRSTVGTVTEIYDFLRIFFARLGKGECPECGKYLITRTIDDISNEILKKYKNKRISIVVNIAKFQKGTFKTVFESLKRKGFSRIKVDGEIYTLDSPPELVKNKKHTIDLIIDRIKITESKSGRLTDSLELAFSHNTDIVEITDENGNTESFSTAAICPIHKISLPASSPQLFSFNSPVGYCETCYGIGGISVMDPDLMIPDKSLTINNRGILPLMPYVLKKYAKQLNCIYKKYGFNPDTPIEEIPTKGINALINGDYSCYWGGIIKMLELQETYTRGYSSNVSRFRKYEPCPACKGSRLRPEALSYKIGGLNIYEFTELPVKKALSFIINIKFEGSDKIIAKPLIKELVHRMTFLVKVGLGYLTLSRSMSTLSGGEAQRIRLASQLGTGLVGVTYVLDEPSIGLHPKDNNKLLETLRTLQTRGNTVIVVEHDEKTILTADHIVELGPGSGKLGGDLVFEGHVKKMLSSANSLTAKYLRGDIKVKTHFSRCNDTNDFLLLKNVTTHNLKNLNCKIPLGCLVCVTGVSGSGKSSLVVDTLYKHIALSKGIKVESPGVLRGFEGIENIEKAVLIDQTPIGRTPRSNPATYTKIFDEIRKIFSSLPEARTKGYKPGRFSFNVKGGRCENCKGDGEIKIEMHFLPDIYVTCETCKGKRYNRETLEIKYKGKNISEILEMTVREALEFFGQPTLKRRLKVLSEVGLEYIQLGQSATTLSGGEAQRIKISRELGKKNLPGTLYILDEPTTGLHMHEVGKLIEVLHKLVDKGATVVVIEHNTDVIKSADYIIDLGPEGGEEGGYIIAEGTPEQIRQNSNSVTGKFL